MTTKMIKERVKKCTCCEQVKPITDFYVNTTRPNGTIVYHARCKLCYSAHYASKWHTQEEKDKRKELFRRREKFNSSWHKDYRVRTKYGITLEQYDQMFDAQQGKCYICGNLTQKDKICVDHDHISGQVRKLLCFRCNTTLGQVGENVELLQALINYIIEHNHVNIQEA